MSIQQPLQPSASSWAAPIALGALATFVLHSLTLPLPGLWFAVCCTCGLSGAPVGFLPAFLAKRADPLLGPGQGFAVSFIGTGFGALTVAFLVMAVRGWEVPPEVLEQVREFLEQWNSQAPPGEEFSPEEIDQVVEQAGRLARFVPVVGSGVVSIIGGLTGLITVLIMGRPVPPTPPA